jgi:hypothetical protein
MRFPFDIRNDIMRAERADAALSRALDVLDVKGCESAARAVDAERKALRATLESLRAELDGAERAQAQAYASRALVPAAFLAYLTKDR